MKSTFLMLLFALGALSGALPAEQLASFEGTVVEQGTGQPIARARALLAKGDSVDPNQAMSGLTDNEGRFSIRDVPPGIYRLYVGHSAYVPAEYGQRSSGKPGSLIVVTEGEVLRVNVPLTPMSSVHGKVVNQLGEPVVNFLVKVFRARYERGERVFRGGEYAVTDETGEFKLFGLAPGWYFLRAVPPEEFSALPLNAEVVNWPAYYGGATEDDSKPIRLEPGRIFEVGTLVAPRSPAARVRGQAINASTGRPEPDARILLGRKRRTSVEAAGLSAPTLKSGFFELAGAAPGDYVIDAVAPSLAGYVAFQARGADTETVRILLYPRASLSGRVRLEDAAKESLAASLARMRVVLDSGRAVIEAPIDSKGAFTLVNVPVGDYRLSLSGAPPNAYIKTARAGSVDLLAAGVHVGPKTSGPFEIMIGSTSSVLGVIVLDAKRQPVPGAIVALIPQAKRRSELYRSAVADDAGNARFETVAPGEYRLYSWEDLEENAWQDPDIVTAYDKSGETVTVKETGLSIVTVNVNPL